jgi:hypothetical protein
VAAVVGFGAHILSLHSGVLLIVDQADACRSLDLD